MQQNLKVAVATVYIFRRGVSVNLSFVTTSIGSHGAKTQSFVFKCMCMGNGNTIPSTSEKIEGDMPRCCSQ